MSWKPEVIADSTGKWVGNALRFEMRKEAEENARDLMGRWFAVRETVFRRGQLPLCRWAADSDRKRRRVMKREPNGRRTLLRARAKLIRALKYINKRGRYLNFVDWWSAATLLTARIDAINCELKGGCNGKAA